MRCVISHRSAYWLWYNLGREGLDAKRPANSRSLAETASTLGQLNRFDIGGISKLLVPPSALQLSDAAGAASTNRDVLVPRGADGHATKGFRRHRHKGDVPAGSLLMVGNGIAACSPEFCLVQLAAELDPAEFVRWATALCACYRVGEKGVEGCLPVTSVERIRSFLDACAGYRGAKRCRRLLWLVRDGARSPKEVELHLLLALPASMGGYGLGGDVLNWRIELGEDDSAMADRPDWRWVAVDVAWPDAGVGVEYQGREHDDTVCADRRRLNLLQGLGMRMVQVDREQVSDPARFDATARVVATLLRKDVPEPTDEWLTRRGSLRQTLLGQGHVRM